MIFTSGGTESDNQAVKGLFWSRTAEEPQRTTIITTSVEHHAILDATAWLAHHEGAKVVQLPVNESGAVNPQDLDDLLRTAGPEVALVTVMVANNEVGTIQPVRQLSDITSSYGIPMHTDAVAAMGHIPVDFAASGVSAMSVSGHKLGGPIGIGALVLNRETGCCPLLHGGGQEREIRSGTLDVPAIAAFAAAAQTAVAAQPESARQLATLRDELVSRVLLTIPGATLNGDAHNRLPGNAHFSFPSCEGDALLLLLDAHHIACSTGSACSAGVARPSHVLVAMGADDAAARSSLRFTLGHTSTLGDIDALMAVLPSAVERARRPGGRIPSPP